MITTVMDEDDSLARQEAIDVRHSVIVKAPAGSGKTELLVQRCLALLAKSCDHPRQFVAITFTRKAAAEMRRRLRTELARRDPPTEEHKRKTFNLAEQVRHKAQILGADWHIHNLIDTENITTIDGFCRALVALDADKADFYDMPELAEGNGARRLYIQAVEQAFHRLRKTHRNVALELLYQHENRLSKLIDNFIGLLNRRVDLLPVMQTASYSAQEDLIQLTLALKHYLLEFAPHDIFQKHATILAHLAGLAREDFTSAEKVARLTISHWQDLAAVLLTQNGALRKRVTRNDVLTFDAQQKRALEDLLADLADETLFTQRLNASQQWSDAYDQQERMLSDHARLLFTEAVKELMILFKTQNTCDYTEILLAAQRVTDGEDAPSLLAERLGYQLRHLLVDEFQDTSSAQLRLLVNLSQSWDASTNNTLFLVGDPMQSVYSFRNANVRIFNRLWQGRRLGQVALKQITLTRNYRSGQKLVKWFNDQFTHTLSPTEAAGDQANLMDAIGYTPSATGLTAEDLAEAPFWLGVKYPKEKKPTPEQEYASLIARLGMLVQTHPHDSIAVLGRNRNHIVRILPLLARDGLDFNASQIVRIGESMQIRDLLSLTRGLANPDDHLAWYSILRSPWCGLELADLHTIAATYRQHKRTLWEQLQILARSDTLTAEGRARLEHCITALLPVMRSVGRTHWSDTVERAWLRLGGRSLLKDEQEEERCLLFLRALEDQSKAGSIDFGALGAQLDEEELGLASTAPIQVMTIHKAKGLEFDHVFLLHTEKSSMQGYKEHDTLRILSFAPPTDDAAHAFEANETAIFALRFPIDPPTMKPAYKMLNFVQRERAEQEERRLFYVACTRAKKGLYMHYVTREDRLVKPRGSFLSFMPNMHATLLDRAEKDETAVQRPEPRIHSLQRIPLKQMGPTEAEPKAAKENGAEAQPEERAASDPRHASIRRWSPPLERARGLLIHHLMEVLSDTNIEEVTTKKKQEDLIQQAIASFTPRLKEDGLVPTDIKKLGRECETAARRTLADARGSWILKTRETEAHTEWGLLLPGGKGIRLDRTFVDEGTRWIVDYKTFDPGLPLTQEAAETEYLGQLQNYGAALTTWQAARPQQYPLRLGIYCPQNGAWYEWDYDPART